MMPLPPKHEDGEFCPSCEDKLTKVDLVLVGWYRVKKKKYVNLHISWGFRNKEDQDKMFEEKKSKEQWPNSAHNFMKNGWPCSRALDLFQIDEDGVARFSKDFYQLLAKEIKQNQDPISWAGNWTAFVGDYNHFQLLNG